MKEKDLLKLLKTEVVSIMPDCLQAVKNKNVTPEKNETIKIDAEQNQSTKKARATLAFACCMMLVFTLMICMPFIISSRQGDSNKLHNPTQVETSETSDTSDDK